MPEKWSEKRERQYEHIRRGEVRRGRSAKRAKEIAARTVNKQRAERGEADSSSRSKRVTKLPRRKPASGRKTPVTRTATRKSASKRPAKKRTAKKGAKKGAKKTSTRTRRTTGSS
jgi:hypothetical protein